MTEYEKFAKSEKEDLIYTKELHDLCSELKFLEKRKDMIIDELYRRFSNLSKDEIEEVTGVKRKVKMVEGKIIEM